MSCAFAENSHAVRLDSVQTIARNRHHEDRFYSSCKTRAASHDGRATSDLPIVRRIGTFLADSRQRLRLVIPTRDGSRRGEQVAVPLQPTVHTESLGGLCDGRIESGQRPANGRRGLSRSGLPIQVMSRAKAERIEHEYRQDDRHHSRSSLPFTVRLVGHRLSPSRHSRRPRRTSSRARRKCTDLFGRPRTFLADRGLLRKAPICTENEDCLN
jgi:hypothetical protein